MEVKAVKEYRTSGTIFERDRQLDGIQLKGTTSKTWLLDCQTIKLNSSRLPIANEERILIQCCDMIIVLVPIHGLQRFWLGQVGMGSATCSLSRFSVGWQYLRSRRLEGLGFNYYQKVAS